MKIPFLPYTNIGFHRALLLLCFLISFSLYADSLGNDFLFDDNNLIVNNYKLQQNPGLSDFMPGNKIITGYRPVRFLSLLIDYKIYGLNPAGFRLTNIIIHSLNGFLIFLVAIGLGLSRKAAIISCIVFLSHPIMTDSVTYISGRRDILFTFFYLMGFYFFMRFYNRQSLLRNAIVFILFILSIFSKEMGASFPIMLLWYTFWREGRSGRTGKTVVYEVCLQIKRTWQRSAFLFSLLIIMSLSFIYYKIFIWNPSFNYPYYGGTFLNNLLTVSQVFVYYIGLILVPIPLKGDYLGAFPIVDNPLAPLAWASFACLILLGSNAVLLVKKRPILSFSLIWFFIALLPVSHLIPHHELMAEHYLYLPIAGFAFICGDFFGKQRRGSISKLVTIILILLIGFYGGRTMMRNKDWRTAGTFWESTLHVGSFGYRAAVNLAVYYSSIGNDAKFVFYTQKALLYKNDYKILMNLAGFYDQKNDYPKAIQYYREAMKVESTNPKAFVYLASLYKRMKENQLALDVLNAFKQRKNNNSIEFMRAQIFIDENRFSDALKILEGIPPKKFVDLGYYYYFGLAAEKSGLFDKALLAYETGMQFQNKFHLIITRKYIFMLGQAGQSQEAVRAAKNFLMKFPNDMQIKLLLARVAFVQRQYFEAETYFNEIIESQGNCPECYLTLAMIAHKVYSNDAKAIELLDKAEKQDIEGKMKLDISLVRSMLSVPVND